MRTLALYWPTLSGDADRAVRLRSARHALGRLSPLVAERDSFGLIEVGIDGLQARSGSERDIAAIALRAVGVHLRERPSACRALRSRTSRSPVAEPAPPAARLSVGQ